MTSLSAFAFGCSNVVLQTSNIGFLKTIWRCLKDVLCRLGSLLVKSYFHSWFFFHLRIALLILHRAPIILFLLVREKEPPILIFLNIYLTLNGVHGSIWELNFVSLSFPCKFSFFLLDFDLLEKISFSETNFCSKELSLLRNNINFL